MDQILVSVCCPPQNKHIDIKKVANSHVGVTVKKRQKRPKIHVPLLLLLLLLLLLRHTFPFLSGSFSGTTIDTSISNIPLEPLSSVDETFVRLVDIVSHLEGQIPSKPPKNGRE